MSETEHHIEKIINNLTAVLYSLISLKKKKSSKRLHICCVRLAVMIHIDLYDVSSKFHLYVTRAVNTTELFCFIYCYYSAVHQDYSKPHHSKECSHLLLQECSHPWPCSRTLTLQHRWPTLETCLQSWTQWLGIQWCRQPRGSRTQVASKEQWLIQGHRLDLNNVLL